MNISNAFLSLKRIPCISLVLSIKYKCLETLFFLNFVRKKSGKALNIFFKENQKFSYFFTGGFVAKSFFVQLPLFIPDTKIGIFLILEY